MGAAPRAFPALRALILADTSLLQRSDFVRQPLLTQLTYLDLSDSGQPDTFFIQVQCHGLITSISRREFTPGCPGINPHAPDLSPLSRLRCCRTSTAASYHYR